MINSKATVKIFFSIIFLSLLLSFTNRDALAITTSTDQILVKYRNTIDFQDRLKFHRDLNAQHVSSIEKLDVEVFKITSDSEASEIIDRFSQDSRVLYLEKDHIATTYEMTNDPGIVNQIQWGMYKIQAAGIGNSAWNLEKGESIIKVAVVDTGLDIDHEDLKDKIVSSKNCTDSATNNDLYGHGTHVGGIIGAYGNNQIGVAGVGLNISLINAKALGDNGSGYYSWIANCIIWATDTGAKVINLSLGGPSSSKTMVDAINYAWNKGVVLVAAAGNSNTNSPSYPAYLNNVLSVAATDQNDKRASFSNYGNWVDVAAPGVSIYSTLPNHQNSFKKYNYGYLSGTSMASPHVAGLAGLLFSVDNNYNNQAVVDLIVKNAEKIEGTGSNWMYGRINTYRSIETAISTSNQAKFIPTPTIISLPTVTITPTTHPSETPTPMPAQISTPTNIPKPSVTPTPSPKPTLSLKSPWARICAKHPQLCR